MRASNPIRANSKMSRSPFKRSKSPTRKARPPSWTIGPNSDRIPRIGGRLRQIPIPQLFRGCAGPNPFLFENAAGPSCLGTSGTPAPLRTSNMVHSQMRFDKDFQLTDKPVQFRDALGGRFQPLLLPHKPGFSFFGDANRQVSVQQHAGLTV